MHKQMLQTLRNLPVLLVTAMLVAACATSPGGRKQLKLLPESTINSMGVQSFEDIKQSTPETGKANVRAYVQCIAEAIIPRLPKYNNPAQWEIRVFDDPQANAFALPGNKIGVYEGILQYAQNPHQLAAIMGHELVHVLAEHSNERVSSSLAAEAGVAIANIALGSSELSEENKGLIAAGLGLGVQYGVLLPFSRAHETEADLVGIELMAGAGFDPRESIKLWQNMSQAGSQPPEFLSTHPSHETRIRDLSERMPQAMAKYEQARAENRVPNCAL